MAHEKQKNETFQKRSVRITLVTLLIYALLVATHEGEFWPFSIYPMFSQAGNPWTRAMITDVTNLPEDEIWEIRDLDQIMGEPVPVGAYGVDQIDFSNFVSKTESWTESRMQALIVMFGRENLDGKKWMVKKVDGRLSSPDEIEVITTPFILMTADSTYRNPHLPNEYYFRGVSHE